MTGFKRSYDQKKKNIRPTDCLKEPDRVTVTSPKENGLSLANEMKSTQSPFFSDTGTAMLEPHAVDKQLLVQVSLMVHSHRTQPARQPIRDSALNT